MVDSSGTIAGVIVSSYSLAYALQVMNDVPQNVNFAVKDIVAKDFLRTHSVSFAERKQAPTSSVADIGEGMRRYTVLLRCIND